MKVWGKKTYTSFDAESELTKMLSEQISKEIDSEIISEIDSEFTADRIFKERLSLLKQLLREEEINKIMDDNFLTEEEIVSKMMEDIDFDKERWVEKFKKKLIDYVNEKNSKQ